MYVVRYMTCPSVRLVNARYVTGFCVTDVKVDQMISALIWPRVVRAAIPSCTLTTTILIESIRHNSVCAILHYATVTARMSPESIRKFFLALPFRKKSKY